MSVPVLTGRESDLFIKAMQHCLQNPEGLKIDYKKFMDAGSFKTEASARASWCGIKKKIFGPPSSGEANNSSGNKTPTHGDNGAVADDEATPTAESPKKKGGRKPKAVANAGEAVNSDDTPTTPSKKRVRKPKDPNAPPAKRAKKGAKAEPAAEPEVEVEGEEKGVVESIFGNGNDGEEAKAKNEGGGEEVEGEAATEEQGEEEGDDA